MTEAAESNVTQLPVPSAPKPPIVAGITPRAIVPQDFDQVWRLALAIEASGLAPRDMDKAEQITVAIMHGLEIGLPPMQSIQRIAVINGRPTLWGDGVMAVVRASGKLETIREWMEGEGDNRVAICEAKRRDDPQSIRRAFSVADAKRASLWSKKGPWQDYPERMMQMRARAFCLRDGFADVMGGFYVREEIEDEIAENARDVTPAQPNADPERVTRTATRPGPPPTVAAIEHKPAVEIVQETQRAPVTVETGFPAGIIEGQAKPVVAAPEQDKRRPGPPPGAASKAVAAVQDVFPGAQHVETRPQAKATPLRTAPTFDDMRTRFAAAAAKAADADTLNEAWESIIGPHEDGLMPPDHEDLLGIFRQREHELEG